MHTSNEEPHKISQQLSKDFFQIEVLWHSLKAKPNNHSKEIEELRTVLHNLSQTAIMASADDINSRIQTLTAYMSRTKSIINPTSQRLFQQLKGTLKQWQIELENKEINYTQNNRTPCQTNIYLIEDKTKVATDISIQLKNSHFCVHHFTDVNDIKKTLNQKQPDAIIMDISLNENNNIKKILTQYDTKIPVIMIATCNDMETRLKSVRAGATRFFTHPIDYPDFIEAIAGLTLRQRQVPYRVLIIENDSFIAEKYRTILECHNINVKILTRPLKTLEAISTFKPELILTDLHMPDCSGQELTAVIRQDKNYAQLPIIFLSSETDPHSQMLAMSMGADDFLTKPTQDQHLIALIQIRLKRYRWLERMRNNLEKSLRETQYQQLAMDNHAIVSITNPSGEITYANEKFCDISGFKQHELIGQQHRIINSGVHSTKFFSSMWETISEGKVWQADICNKNKNGNLYWVKSTIVPFLTPSGQPYKYVSVRTDITQEKTLENKLRTTRDHLNLLLNTSPIILYNIKVTPNDISIEWVSDNTTRLLGINKNSLTKENSWEKYVHHEDQKFVRETLRNQPAPEHPLLLEYRLVREDGSELWVQDHIKINTNEHSLNIVGAWTDHTKFHDIQHQLIKNEERLRRSQRYANIGTWDWNIVTGTLIWSERVAPLFGYKKGKLETTYADFLNSIHPEDIEVVINAINACLNEGTEYNIEYRCIWPNGEVHWLLERGDVLRDTHGAPQHMLGVVQDITPQKQMAQALREAKIEAENANQAKSRFLSSMSHELRTPMHAILGFTQLMIIDPDDPLSESHQENINEILKAGQHLLDLINEVLDLAKIESGNIDLNIQSVSPHTIINECISLIAPLAAKHSIKLHIDNDLKDDKKTISTDPVRFRQIILNLLSNAVKYNKENGKILLTTSYSELEYRIEISDTGLGIPQERLSELFKPFSRLVDEHIPIEGSGIGLVVTKEIVERMNGSIGVKSTKDVGSTFWVTLPHKAHHLN